ncbi:hypothetical protein ACPV5W_00670 [Vibrio astriarenae]
MEPHVPYGVISNRHGKGALVGEYPRRKQQPNPSAEFPERYGNVSILSPIYKEGADSIPGAFIDTPLGETAEFWIPVGLDEDLNIAMQNATRESIRFLVNHYGISEEIALAYLSANTDFAVSQVVDKTKGIHAKIRKSDFAEFDAE